MGGLLRGVVPADLAPDFGESVSLDIRDEAGLLPTFVGVSGALLPAAGDGAILWKLLTVSGEDCLDVEDLVVGDQRLGVGGKE